MRHMPRESAYDNRHSQKPGYILGLSAAPGPARLVLLRRGGGAAALAMIIQRALFCPCGALPAVARVCRRCYARAASSRRRFAGNREAALARDGRRCQACGGREWLAGSRRQSGCHDLDCLITVCAACHARLHRLAAVRRWIPEALAPLWAEQHPGSPLQLQLPLEALL